MIMMFQHNFSTLWKVCTRILVQWWSCIAACWHMRFFWWTQNNNIVQDLIVDNLTFFYYVIFGFRKNWMIPRVISYFYVDHSTIVTPEGREITKMIKFHFQWRNKEIIQGRTINMLILNDNSSNWRLLFLQERHH